MRPQLLRFDGRLHNEIVAEFVRLEDALRKISPQRLSRAASGCYIAIANTHGKQSANVGVDSISAGHARPNIPRAILEKCPM